jgi:hypothetical protein
VRWTPEPRTNVEDRRAQTPTSDSLLYGVNNKMQRLQQATNPLRIQGGVGRRVKLAGEEGDTLVYSDERGNKFNVPRSVVGQPTQAAAPAPVQLTIDRKAEVLADLRRRLGLL